MCYHGQEISNQSRIDRNPKDEQREGNSVFKGRGNPTYAGHLPKKYG